MGALPQKFPKFFELMTGDLDDRRAAQDRFEEMIETPGMQPVLACLLNLTTAMAAIDMPVGKALDYFGG